jgi:indolepyruvate ferredoxin oxidoreductase
LVAGLADESTATFATGRTLALVNTDVAATAAFQFDRNASVDTRLLRARLSRVIGDGRTVNVPATALANSLLGDSLAANLMMVGVAAQRGLLPVGTRAIEQAIELNGAAVPFNLAAFRLGRLFAARPETVLSDLPESGEASPQTVDTVIARQSERLTGYQDSRYADRYRTLVERVREREQAAAPGNEALTLAVARGYAKVLAYKDEYEVARLLSSSTLKVEFDRAFADGGRYGFNLAPPVLGGRPVNGRPPKREFDARLMRPLLGILARAKFLRHTIFDPFGGTHERRLERALICDYEGLIESVLEALSPNNHAAAVELLTLIDEVRGYGPVKVAAVGKYRAAIPAAQAAFARASSIASTAA